MTTVSAQTPARPLSVGILLYPGVEVLDFSGPAEVFAATAGFEPFLVAMTTESIVSQGFIEVVPQYSLADCPPTDIIVLPGGGTGNVINKPELIDWIKARAQTTQFMLSVCTGAALLSKAGLLDGLEVTTWHGFIHNLQRMTPTATVLTDTRFVDNGRIITTAGVSAGIDGALHLVSRVRGEAAARATARYMEYDKWAPEMGKVNATPFVAAVRERGLSTALQAHPGIGGQAQPAFYDGELINLANHLLTNQPAESEAIYRWLAETVHPTTAFYDEMGRALRQLGRPAPAVDRATFLQKIKLGEIDWARQTYAAIQRAHPGWLLFTEADLNTAAYHGFYHGKEPRVLAAFQWATELYPGSANAWDSLSEAYEHTGEHAAAIAASKRCLALLPGADVAQRDKLEKIARERIDRLQR